MATKPLKVWNGIRGGRVNIRAGEYYVELTKYQFHYLGGQEAALNFTDANWRDGCGDLMVRVADFAFLSDYPNNISTESVAILSKVV